MKKEKKLFPDGAKCPICKKQFLPAPLHQWKIKKNGVKVKVCSYSCMRVWEKPYLKEQKEKFDARAAKYDAMGNKLR